jgi:hypothetical protein
MFSSRGLEGVGRRRWGKGRRTIHTVFIDAGARQCSIVATSLCRSAAGGHASSQSGEIERGRGVFLAAVVGVCRGFGVGIPSIAVGSHPKQRHGRVCNVTRPKAICDRVGGCWRIKSQKQQPIMYCLALSSEDNVSAAG